MIFKSYSSVMYSCKVNDTTYLLVLRGYVIGIFSSQQVCDEFVMEFMSVSR